MKREAKSAWTPPHTTKAGYVLTSKGHGADTQWVPVSALSSSGAAGSQGSQGTQGSQGSQGSSGSTGATGPQGPQGVPGSSGSGGSANVWHKYDSFGSLSWGPTSETFVDSITISGYQYYWVIYTVTIVARPYENVASVAQAFLSPSGASMDGTSSYANVPYMDSTTTGTSITMDTQLTVQSTAVAPSSSTAVTIFAYANVTSSNGVGNYQDSYLTVIGVH
jgi:hypothetical protein